MRAVICFCVVVFGGSMGPSSASGQPFVFWGDNLTNQIWRANLDGSMAEIVVTSQVGNPSSLHFNPVDGRLYWSDSEIGGILRADPSIGTPEVLQVVGQPFALGLDFVAGRLYWVDRATSRLQRCSLDGSDFEDLAPVPSGSAQSGVFDTIQGTYYFTDWTNDVIYRVNADGSDLQAIVTGLTQPAGIGIDPAGGRIYWVDRNPGILESANLDGTDVEPIVTFSNALGIAVDGAAGRVFYGENSIDQVRSVNLDGSDDQLVFDGVPSPLSIALTSVGTPASQLFTRGDTNGDGGVDVSDAVFALAGLFIPGSLPPECDDATDVNDDGGFDVSDAVYLLASLFIPGAPPAPDPLDCGSDPTADSLGCDRFASCP